MAKVPKAKAPKEKQDPKQFKVHPRLPYLLLQHAMKDGYSNIDKTKIAAFQLGKSEKFRRFTEMMTDINVSMESNYSTEPSSFSSTPLPSEDIAHFLLLELMGDGTRDTSCFAKSC